MHLEALPPLVARASCPRYIHGRYLHGGALRLRSVQTPGDITRYKLGKKYPVQAAGGEAYEQAVVSIYLSDLEYEALTHLPGAGYIKRRYRLDSGALDAYEFPAHGFAVFEREYATLAAAQADCAPDFAGAEIAGEPAFGGHALARLDGGGSYQRC